MNRREADRLFDMAATVCVIMLLFSLAKWMGWIK